MTQALKTAIAEVNAVIESKIRELAELKRTVNALCQQAGLKPQYEATDSADEVGRRVVLHRDSYYGRPLGRAIREHLEALRHALPLEELLSALEQGGFDFDTFGWAPENRLRNLAISVSKNPLLKRLPSGVIGLKSWYDDAAKEPGNQSATTRKRATAAKRKRGARKATKTPQQTKSSKGAEKSSAKNESKARNTATVKHQSGGVKKTAARAEKVATSGHAQPEHVH